MGYGHALVSADQVNHVTSASEYGWRTGTGKWPAYYPDNLPAVVNIGQGSPTGVLMGIGGAFPEKYQRSFFVFDWSFGTIYSVEMTPDGSSYTGTFEEFCQVSRCPLPMGSGARWQYVLCNRRAKSGVPSI